MPQAAANPRVPVDPTQATNVRVRTRVRAVDVETTTPARPAYETELERFVRLNIEANAAKREADKAKEALASAMAKADVTKFTLAVDGRNWEADFTPSDGKEVNVDRLFKLVDLKTFLSVAKVTQGAVKDACGNNVLASVLDDVKKPAALTVKEKKN